MDDISGNLGDWEISALINSEGISGKIKEALHSKSSSGLPLGVSCSREPFPHCIINDFLVEDSSVSEIEKTVKKLEFFDKSNDLYKFKQTKALEKRSESAIKSFRCALDKLRKKLSNIFDVKLSDQIDMFSAKYNYTDTLLCHDDELEGRRIAYIYYLVPADWCAADGGALELFSTQPDTGLPDVVVKTITPVRNSLLFFEVTHKSFHQVAEVLSQSKCRLSISGWFHGTPYPRPPSSAEESPILQQISPVDIDEDALYSSINNEYISPLTQSEIQEKFEDDSEIQLTDFLPKEKYESICKDMKSESIAWKRVGPAIKRNIEVAEGESLPSSIKECIKLLTSDAMFLILSNVTGLKLHPLASDSGSEDEGGASTSEPQAKKSKHNTDTDTGEDGGTCGHVSYQVRRWSHGAYTLLHDTDLEQGKDFALDAVMCFNCEEWEDRQGGYTSYIAKGDDEELLTLEPRENCLSLVYRDVESLRFVKHVNHRITQTPHPYFYDISLIYTEV